MQPQQKNWIITPTRSSSMSGILFAFVVLSVLAHASVLLFSDEQESPVPAQNFGTTFISTVLISNDSPEKNSLPTPLQQPIKKSQKPLPNFSIIAANNAGIDIKPQSASRSKTNFTRTLEKTVQQSTARKAVNTPDKKSSTVVATIFRQQQRNYLLGELQNRLSKYLVYPLRARRRGWQGDVMVAFHVNEKGQLGGVHLARSSGYSLLDHSALKAINNLGIIAVPTQFGPLQAMNLQLPVYYRLQES